jgi:ABC-type sugar transport system permease subunit
MPALVTTSQTHGVAPPAPAQRGQFLRHTKLEIRGDSHTMEAAFTSIIATVMKTMVAFVLSFLVAHLASLKIASTKQGRETVRTLAFLLIFGAVLFLFILSKSPAK